MRGEKMVSKEPSARKRLRAGWAIAAVALLLLAGAWVLNRRTDTPMLTAGSDAPASTPMLAQQGAVTKATTGASHAGTDPTVPPPSVMPTQSTGNDLHKLQLAFEAGASPQADREAAQILSVCQGADAAAKAIYSLRDQGDAAWRQLEKRRDFNPEKLIEASQDTQRRCQVFDAATLARRGELLKRAYEGGAKETALDYLLWLNAESRQKADPELLSNLQREARRSAEGGDLEALLVFSNGINSALGLTPVQRQAYKEALYRIETELLGSDLANAGQDARTSLEKTTSQSAPQALSPEQQREADELTERVVGAWRKQQGGTSG